MRIEALFHGTISETGAFHADNPEAFAQARITYRNKRVTVGLSEYSDPLSPELRKYYFGVVVKMIADEMGERDKEKAHETLKKLFLYDMVVVRKTGTTTDQDTKEMREVIDTIREWAAGEPLNLYIPDPNEARPKERTNGSN